MATPPPLVTDSKFEHNTWKIKYLNSAIRTVLLKALSKSHPESIALWAHVVQEEKNWSSQIAIGTVSKSIKHLGRDDQRSTPGMSPMSDLNKELQQKPYCKTVLFRKQA